MKPLDTISPVHAACGPGVGSGTVIATAVMALVRYKPHAYPGLSFWVPMLGGYVLLFLMERPLIRGIEAGRWSETELEPVRRWFVGERLGVLAGIRMPLMLGIAGWPLFTKAPALFPIALLAFMFPTRVATAL